MRPISGMNATFTVSAPASVHVSGHIDVEHRGSIDDAVMVAFNLQLNGAWMLGSKTGCNILNETHHYAALPIAGFAEVPAGTHTIQLFGRSGSTAAPNADGLAEVKPGYNLMVVRVE